MQQPEINNAKYRPGIGFPVLLIVCGGLWLLSELGVHIDWNMVLPLLVIGLGVFFLVCNRRRADAFVLVVILVVAVGGLLISLRTDSLSDVLTNTLRFGGHRIDTATTDLSVTREEYPEVESVDMRIDIGTGNYSLTTIADDTHLFTSSGTYNYEELKPELGASLSAKTLKLTYDARHQNSFLFAPDVIAEYANNLSKPELPTTVDVSIGSGKATIDYESIAVESTVLEVGSGTIDLSVSGSTPLESELSFTVGSGKLTADGLGNAKLKTLTGDFGSGTVTLDLSGTHLSKQLDVNLDGGSGTMYVIIPKNVGFSVDGSVGSGRLRVDGDTAEDDDFTSENYETADAVFNFTVELGSGTIEISTQ